MPREIDQIIIRLEMVNKVLKRLLETASDQMTEDEINAALDEINRNNEAIKKLKQR